MKKVLLFLGLIMCSIGLAKADGGRIYDKPLIRYTLSVAANVSTAAVVIDLSDTTNWPHKRDKELHLYNIKAYVDKAAASTATVKIGVVNQINASTGSVTWFFGVENARNVSNTVNLEYVESDLVYNLLVKPASSLDAPGSTPYILSNDTTLGSTIYQTDVFLPSPVGNTRPGRGDLVVSVANGTAVIDVYLEISYEGAN